MSKNTVITAIENTVQDTKKKGGKSKVDTAKVDTAKVDTAKVDTAKVDTAKVEKGGKGYTAFTDNKLSVKVVTSDDLPKYEYSYNGQTAENKAIEYYKFTDGGKEYYLTSNFDGAFYGYDLPTLYKKAKESGKVTAIAKGGKESKDAGYTENENIDFSKVSVFSKRLLVYVKAFTIEVDNKVYLYLVRGKGGSGYNYRYDNKKGFYIA